MRRKFDRESDALYFRLDESSIVGSEEAGPGIILDYAANDNVVCIEILGLSKRMSEDLLHTFQFDTR